MNKQIKEGQVVWREFVSCTDVARAKVFYGELFNWTFEDMNMAEGFTYTVAIRDGIRVGGFMPAMPQVKSPPAWLAYVSVADVDATVKAAKDNGGMAPMDPQSIPGVGRFGVIGDPT